MTGFLLTAKQKLMLCINKRLYSAGGYNYLTQVTIEPIPYTESDNAAGGTTVTIA